MSKYDEISTGGYVVIGQSLTPGLFFHLPDQHLLRYDSLTVNFQETAMSSQSYDDIRFQEVIRYLDNMAMIVDKKGVK